MGVSVLRAPDFKRHPVWIGCHTADYDEPWYDDTDEETFRPRMGPLPADPSEGMLLVRATVRLNDATSLEGFLTPSCERDLGIVQPHVFVRDRVYGFWGGVLGTREETRNRFCSDVGKRPDEVFPLHAIAGPQLSRGVVEVTISGWSPSTQDAPTVRLRRRRWLGRRG